MPACSQASHAASAGLLELPPHAVSKLVPSNTSADALARLPRNSPALLPESHDNARRASGTKTLVRLQSRAGEDRGRARVELRSGLPVAFRAFKSR
jgi:hypothetical protein